MKYLCLVYEAEETFTSISPPEWGILRDETLAYVSSLQRSGHLLVTNALLQR
jgi:hypothetical protein